MFNSKINSGDHVGSILWFDLFVHIHHNDSKFKEGIRLRDMCGIQEEFKYTIKDEISDRIYWFGSNADSDWRWTICWNEDPAVTSDLAAFVFNSFNMFCYLGYKEPERFTESQKLDLLPRYDASTYTCVWVILPNLYGKIWKNFFDFLNIFEPETWSFGYG